MKVLLFSNDLMPFGSLPTSGGGLRCWHLMKGLQSHGVEVVASMPGFTYLAEKNFDKIPQEQRELLWQFGSQDDILRRVKPDAVLFASNWDHYNLSRKPSVPLIVDLHGSRLIETSMWGAAVSTERKVSILNQADCLLCAGRYQRSYFYGWLVQAGRVPEDEHFIRYIPVSVSPELPEHFYPAADDADAPRFVSGGGWFPWQNQSKAIFAIAQAVSSRNRGTLAIYGGPHEKIGNSAEEQHIFDIFKQVKGIADSSSRIDLSDYVGRNELIEVYRRASVAVELMTYNLERELAFTTRTIEYLWCGLPVIYNDFAEISEHIREWDAGWSISAEDDKAIEAVIAEIYENPELVAAKGRNASALARERFSWDKTIAPLLDFLNSPSLAAKVEPALGSVYARPAYLNARGPLVDVPLGAGRSEFVQRFVVPAENISALELPLTLLDGARAGVKKVELSLCKPGSVRALARAKFSGDEIPKSGRLKLRFPMLLQPSGGDELELKVVISCGALSAEDKPFLYVQTLAEPLYPLLVDEGRSYRGKTLTDDSAEGLALALSFVPEEQSQVYQVRVLFKRALLMIKSGQWKRFFRALKRRFGIAASGLLKRAVSAAS